VIAFVELAGAARDSTKAGEASIEALHAWCRERLAPYKQPAQIRVLAALPAASTGKILKHQLRAMI
jgi:long-chain acyl-CoA synthetase